MDLTASPQVLARAAADLLRLLPGRTLDPVLSGVVLEADADGVVLAGTDRERGVRLHRTARVHRAGRLLVPARPLAEVLRHLDAPEVRLVLEGSRLALRTPGARFALPLLDLDAHPGVRAAPPALGSLDTALLPRAAVVAGAASRDDALPVFTGVHLTRRGDRLVLVGTDRFRMAVADLPWRPVAEGTDLLVPAGVLTEVSRQAEGAEVVLHGDADRAGFGWPGAEVTTAVLDAPFPDESQHLAAPFDGTVELPAADLAAALRRVAPFAGPQATVLLDVGDGEVRLRATGTGDAEESVKATTGGDRISTGYQPRYLADALGAFGSDRVRIGLRSGHRRATVLTAADPTAAHLHYVVMPKRL
ncbi:DNA polymerase III subunit beta [Saccharopolyspora sp. CA-218241]|uniref:DNA polymerase III subunit beta n=1 Tax=Saccharopolyspora sp. CA-218241 TaxID=3240027 RepID=UPI003D96EE18